MPVAWYFWIDVGGTFTDCVARRPDGTLVRHKLLSSGVTKGSIESGSTTQAIVDAARWHDPPDFWVGYKFRLIDQHGGVLAESTVAAFDSSPGRLRLNTPLVADPVVGQSYELASDEEAPIIAVRHLLELRRVDPIPPITMRLGTTRGTNALLTRRGARTALITTLGFGDVLHIGYQNRPKLFELTIRKPPPLFATVVEIDERMAASGEVLRPINVAQVQQQLASLRSSGIDSIAICLLHATENTEHEQLVGRLAREAGFVEVSVSSKVAPLVKIVPRGDTTVLDAYLSPVLRSYVSGLRHALAGSDLTLLTSAGALVAADQFRGKDSILSGPAGGAVGFARVAEAAGFSRAIGFDMGGTSTDVSRFDGRFDLEYETEKAGVRIVAPTIAIETVAAGGGSICRFDGVKLVVGPDSAGADPGPACYGRGGPLTVTDINLVLGKVLPERFPFALDRAAAERRLGQIAGEIATATGRTMNAIELADGFLQVANANMAKAIRNISVAKGYDPADYVLVPFGGAGGQHACALAAELGMRQILIHPDAGVLSALGIGMAEHARHRSAGVYRPLDNATLAVVAETFEQLRGEAIAELQVEMRGERLEDRVEVRRSLDLRYRGVDQAMTISEPTDSDWRAAFEAEHRRRYGYLHERRELEVVAARVEVAIKSETALSATWPIGGRTATPSSTTTAHFGGRAYETGVFWREQLRSGDRINGPAVVLESSSTTVIDPGWTGEVLSGGELLLQYSASPDEAVNQRDATAEPDTPDPVQLEIFNNHFAGIAEQMGITLRNTASSVNVKERLDYSCAIFTATGALVVNAPHVPVHLGAMGETVRRIIADNPQMRPGDVFVTNDPYRGGSHLPDVTVVTPVFATEAGDERHVAPPVLFFTASRAHHAEIGGITPGSIPPFSRNLAEEGVLIRNFKLIDAGQARFEELRELLLSAPYPSRAVNDNLADIAAQVAANQQGAVQLVELIRRRSWPVVEAYMRHIQSAAEQKVRLALRKLARQVTRDRGAHAAPLAGGWSFVDHLDDGSPIAVTMAYANDELSIDFTGTGSVLPNNLNANPAIVRAAVMYVLRTLINEDIPLNEGVMAPVRLVLPECLLNPPERADPHDCAAIVGGNVETSQRIVDVLLGALGVAAASQGTMNNVLFGDETFAYYETHCGGSGATAAGSGADAVHTHMTNTRLTDPEVMERRFPVRLQEFSIRHDSGGAGAHRGGNGVVRRIEFLRPLVLSIVSQRRGPYPPYGVQGGGGGAMGRNTLTRAGGRVETLGSSAQLTVAPGDVLTIETPGGGGWGRLVG